MNNIQIQDQEEDFHIERVSKWTVYFLIDLRVLFIITYVYISVIYLISTTANSEANADVNSMMLFNVTPHPNHTNVIVSYIDDALLWSCRNLSVTKDYYKYLYIMLFSAFAVTMVFLVITKLTILFGNRTGISHLWKIAAVQYLQGGLPSIQRYLRPVLEVRHVSDPNSVRNDRNPDVNPDRDDDVDDPDGDAKDPDNDHDVKLAKVCLNLIKAYESIKGTEKQKAVSKAERFNCCRMANLFISAILVLIIVPLAFMSYDLHALSCIAETSDDFIDYDPLTNTVELRYSKNMEVFRKIIVYGFILPFCLLFLLNAGCFYLCNSIIINNMKPLMKPLVELYFNQLEIMQYDETAV